MSQQCLKKYICDMSKVTLNNNNKNLMHYICSVLALFWCNLFCDCLARNMEKPVGSNANLLSGFRTTN
uniref:Uncharacterized protein n=1 Tax=Anguilla anguilla TaxID=7936 RepID=A0A0E9U9H2_ANGAN